MQLPTLTSVRVVPLTVQTEGVVDAKTTGKPDVELATKAGGACRRFWLPGEMKVMVCPSPGGAGSSLPPQALNVRSPATLHAARRIFLVS